jgi:nitroimidazol reductase NimA-like FMN-containing flavoprotein (pyridoxamine 5'-phosphate oxidase superfamily)/GNAT superfamily N-acetyltransferase
MRKEIYRMDRDEAVRFLARAPMIHVASTTPSGAPILRTVHGVVVDGAVAFHGAPAGEKMEAVGREAVVSAEEVIASIPSYFIDPERACPATTYFHSVQVHGPLEEVTDPAAKARVLDALMTKYQPEGGHVPIDADHPLYRKPVAGLLVLRVLLERLDGKAKLGQNRGPAELGQVLEGLWQRGLPDDPRAVDLVRAANAERLAQAGMPLAVPPFLAAPEGVTLLCAPAPHHAEQAAALLADAYWNQGLSPATIAAAHLGATAWVAALDTRGDLIGSARAISDRAKRAWIYDVIVTPAWRKHALGRALVRLLLDHPAVRHVATVHLHTRDQQRFYEKFGFVVTSHTPPTPGGPSFPRSEMLLTRPAPSPSARLS